MGTDFSIRPVGTPSVAPHVPHASHAATQAVATELPPERSVTAAEPSPRVRPEPQSPSDNVSHQVILDRAAASIVYRVVDTRTDLVVKQIPDEGVLRRRAYARALDESKQASHLIRLDRSI